MRRKFQVVVAVTLGLLLAYWLVSPVLSLRSGAPWLPQQPPSEDRRVFHPNGFSIIPPPGWLVKNGGDGDFAYMNLHTGAKGVRYTPGLTISAFKSAPDLSGFHETSFLDMKAYDRRLPSVGGGDVPYFRYELFITNSDYWYHLYYVIPSDLEKPSYSDVPDAMLPYIRSFRPAQ